MFEEDEVSLVREFPDYSGNCSPGWSGNGDHFGRKFLPQFPAIRPCIGQPEWPRDRRRSQRGSEDATDALVHWVMESTRGNRFL